MIGDELRTSNGSCAFASKTFNDAIIRFSVLTFERDHHSLVILFGESTPLYVMGKLVAQLCDGLQSGFVSSVKHAHTFGGTDLGIEVHFS